MTKAALLRLEFICLFVGIPVATAVFLPATWMFPVLFGFTVVGLILLHLTDEFDWGELFQGWARADWRVIALVMVATAVVCAGVMILTQPDGLFGLVRERPQILLFIIVLYPILSALPQEVLFRVLFVRRYANILPARGTMALNAGIFSLAHLMYWSVIVTILSFLGGLVFAWAYQVKGSFPLAVYLHSVAGIVLFTFGMGVYFYSGNVVRPF